MYIRTSIEIKVSRFVAKNPLRCAYCGPKDGSVKKIQPEEVFYWVEGVRTYEHFGKPFVPFHKRKEFRKTGKEWSEHAEVFTHYQMCEECFKKLLKFMRYHFSLIAEGKIISIHDAYYLTSQRAMCEYTCICCGSKISTRDLYVRRGNSAHVNNVCVYCHKKLQHIVGSQWAN